MGNLHSSEKEKRRIKWEKSVKERKEMKEYEEEELKRYLTFSIKKLVIERNELKDIYNKNKIQFDRLLRNKNKIQEEIKNEIGNEVSDIFLKTFFLKKEQELKECLEHNLKHLNQLEKEIKTEVDEYKINVIIGKYL